MSHKPIIATKTSFVLSEKVCFSGLSFAIHYGQRVAIMGDNGSGKTSLLKMLVGELNPTDGYIGIPVDARLAYVPQVIADRGKNSGGQALIEKLKKSLLKEPNCLLLDEPTNHLDGHNRDFMLSTINQWPHTLVVVSHDEELLRGRFDCIIELSQGETHIFHGSHADYQHERSCKQAALHRSIQKLTQEKNHAHQALMREQARAKSSRLMGEKNIRQRKWPTIVSKSKFGRAQEAHGQKVKAIQQQREDALALLASMRVPEIIKPHFHLSASTPKSGSVISIANGSIGYQSALVNNIYMNIRTSERVALLGDNGSGKTAFAKAIFGDTDVWAEGQWLRPKNHEIGWLDQHYQSLNTNKTVLNTLWDTRPDFTVGEIRKHLNDFLFRKNEDVDKMVGCLSGGELARLSLCVIAAKMPRLIVLDEVTNNLDRATKQHVVEVLKEYPSAMLIISHDRSFLQAIGIHRYFSIEHGTIRELNQP